MKITIEIPDNILSRLLATGKDLSRAALEGIVIEGYCSRELGGGDVRQLLNLETSLDVHTFLDEHNIDLNYSLEEWQKDKRTADENFKQHQALTVAE